MQRKAKEVYFLKIYTCIDIRDIPNYLRAKECNCKQILVFKNDVNFSKISMSKMTSKKGFFKTLTAFFIWSFDPVTLRGGVL